MYLSVSTNEPLSFTKKEDRLNKIYDSDGETGPFWDMKYLEDTQDFYEYGLPDIFTPDYGKCFYGYEGNESVAGREEKSNP